MANFLGPDPLQSTFFIPGGNVPGAGVQVFIYLAGSSTKTTVYKTKAGTAHTNPIVLDSGGNLPSGSQLWIPTGITIKAVYAPSNDTDPPSSPYLTLDNLSGMNDVTVTVSEWVAGPTPTFVSATSFTLVGDQTATFKKGRRLQSNNTAGTIYSTITSAVFGVLTTVSVANDSGSLDSGLSSVSYGVNDPANPSVSPDLVNRTGNSVVSAATTNIWATNGNEVHVTGSTGPITSFGTAFYAGNKRTVVFDSTPTITAGASLQIQGVLSGNSVTVVAGDRWEVLADTTSSLLVTRFPLSGRASVQTLPADYISGFTLTTASTTTYDIAAGSASDSTNTANIVGSAITAKSQSAWAVGSAAGGKLSAAALANNTSYYWFAILKDSDGTVDYGFDIATTPTLPSGYTKYRYLGRALTAAGATTWQTIIQHGDEFSFSTPPALDMSGVPSTANRTLTTMNVPALKVLWVGHIQITTAGTQTMAVILTDPACADVNPASGATPLGSFVISVNTTTTLALGSQARCWTNSSGQIGVRGTLANTMYLVTLGWIDPRGKPV